jgi:hypothetical protein
MPSTATALAGVSSVHFERSPIGLVEVLTSLVLYGIGGFLLYVATILWSGWNVASLLPLIGFSGMALLCFYGAWIGVLHLEVDLSNLPREARCRRKNVLTRLATHHRYKISDNGKVFIQTSVNGKYGGDSVWPVRITGLPRYYDFFLLGRCRFNNVNDAYALARTLAGYLGLSMLDHHGAARKIEDKGPYVWHPPMPDPNDPHRRHHRRRRA